jgi:anti-anti-sigma factor
VDQGLAGMPGRKGTEPRLTVASERAEGAVVVAPIGELDQDTADLLRAELDRALSVEGVRVVVDCGGLLFCDSTGLNVLLSARLRAEEQGRRVHLAALRPMVARVMEITGARAVFVVHDTLAEAVAPDAETG